MYKLKLDKIHVVFVYLIMKESLLKQNVGIVYV